MAKSTIEQELRRLEKIYQRLAHPLALPSAATESQIDSVEATFGRPICNEIKDLWRICNGYGRNALFIRFPTKLSDRNYRKNRDGSWNPPPAGVTISLQNQKTGEDLGSHTANYQLNWDIQSQFEFHSTEQAIAVWSRYLPYDKNEWLSSKVPYFERDYRINTTRVINRHWLPFAEGTLARWNMLFIDSRPTWWGRKFQVVEFVDDPCQVYWKAKGLLDYFRESNDALEWAARFRTKDLVELLRLDREKPND